MRILIALYIIIFPLFFSPASFACAVCFVGRGGTADTYLGTAILLSLLPLSMIGGVIFWVARRYQNDSSEKHDLKQNTLLESSSDASPVPSMSQPHQNKP